MEQQLIGALEEGATVVTANRRLARALAADYAAHRQQTGASVWETPDVLPWGAWLVRTWDSWFDHLADDGAIPPALLAPEQEHALWETVISACEPEARLNVSAAAELAREALALWRGWRLPLRRDNALYGDDVRAFLRWTAAFEARCDELGFIDSARLANAVADRLTHGRLTAPARLLLAGFDELTPQQQTLLQTLRDRGCEVQVVTPSAHETGHALRVAALDTEQEIRLAARWARARLQENSRIGVVVPELGQLRERVARIFEDTLNPQAVLAQAEARSRIFNISLGAPLNRYPIIHSALNILALMTDSLPLATIGHLLRSPFLGYAEEESWRRALLDARLREIGQPAITVRWLQRIADARDQDGQPAYYACPQLVKLLRAFDRVRRAAPNQQSPSRWAQSYTALLRAMGWPGERALASAEYQAIGAWEDALRALAALDCVDSELRAGAALSHLRRISAAVFQPKAGDAPIQILGVLEAAGASFDHLWIMGMHDEAWPQAARPNPLLPATMQRAVPHGCAQRELDYARNVTRRLLASAPEIVVSHPTRDGDRDLFASPLIAPLQEIPAGELKVYAGDDWATAIYRSVSATDIETLIDDQGPPLDTPAHVPGGSTLLRDQAACPFRAFATHRLGARAIEEPAPGLDASARGSLVHDALRGLWTQLKSHAALCAQTPPQLRALVSQVVAEAVEKLRQRLGDYGQARFYGIERERLEKLLTDWLALEKQRAPFEISSLEEKQALDVAGLNLNTRMDRIDRTPDGQYIVIDYKTGEPKTLPWFESRMDEPQLPLYSAFGVHADNTAAVLFAYVKQGAMAYRGIAQQEGLAPSVKAYADDRACEGYASWDEIFADWKRALTALADDIRRGRATVDPKRYPKTCKYCGLPALCRVNEIMGAAGTDVERDDD
ncbi:MAG: PD-(D/E)XK nuclease family protein [Gammaproteobacteria bacterium]